MILIVGNEKVAQRYALDRQIPRADFVVASRSVLEQTRGMTFTQIVVVEGWSKLCQGGAMAALNILMYQGAKWVSGVAS
jgi:hypothetical protein